MGLNLLLDNANPDIWKEYFPTGLVRGITTNPSLLKAANQECSFDNLKSLINKSIELGCKEFHIQAWGNTSEKLENCGLKIADLGDPSINLYIKLPITREGSQAAKKLIESKVNITLTACFEAKQALIAASLGATYIAPYLGRIAANGLNGYEEVIRMQETLRGLRSSTKLLVASIQSHEQIIGLASQGVNTFTIKRNLAEEILYSKSSFDAASRFNQDAMN